MPKLEPKQIQKELDSGLIHPFYWIYGTERMKSRELLKRIRKSVTGTAESEQSGTGVSLFASSFDEEHLDGGEVDAQSIVDSAQSLSLTGGLRFIVIREAHAIRDPEPLAALFGPSFKKDEAPAGSSVCVFLSKDLDGRKKFSKLLSEKAIVVPCEDVSEDEREAWIGYLSKRKGIELPPNLVVQLRSLDPWSLDSVDQELEKLSIAMDGSSVGEAGQVLMGATDPETGSDQFCDAFFGRHYEASLKIVGSFADHPDESLPLLGLLAWNTRYLTLVLADQKNRTRTTKLSPFLAERFSRWGRLWSLDEALRLQSDLSEIDFSLKQTARLPLGLWAVLVTAYCSKR